MPLGFDRDVRLIHPPRSADRFREPIPPLLELRDVAGYPAKHGRMRHLDAALGHHLDQVPVRKPIGDVSAHTQLNDVGVEYPFAVDRVTGDRLRHSAPRAKDSAVYPMPLDAPERLAGVLAVPAHD
jgi:hypothetical protein